MENIISELNTDELNLAAGGALTEEQERRLLEFINATKRVGGTMEQLLMLFWNSPESIEFIKENFWWVRST